MPRFANVPFEEAIEFLREKLNLPTETWTDIWEEAHARAFVVAGAMQEDLLNDLHDALNEAIKNGTTLNDFKKDFNSIVEKSGWTFKQKRGWRAAVVFNTNVRGAYAAGRWVQIQRAKKARPYLRYIGGLSRENRPEHLAWSGTILPVDDPWWSTHFPPNGWGCKCKVVSVSRRELERDGLEVADKAPDDGTVPWRNPNTGEIIEVPVGIDPGFAFNPGESKWGPN